jgi:hypothetical protein
LNHLGFFRAYGTVAVSLMKGVMHAMYHAHMSVIVAMVPTISFTLADVGAFAQQPAKVAAAED